MILQARADRTTHPCLWAWLQSLLLLKRRGVSSASGVTLLEIIIVIALVGSLMVYLVSNLTSVSDAAKEDQARLAMGGISQALQMYRVHNNRYPTSEQGLTALVSNPGVARTWRGPYIESEKLNDPWGQPFSYQAAGRDFVITSAGYDGVLGNEDDISYPEKENPEGGA